MTVRTTRALAVRPSVCTPPGTTLHRHEVGKERVQGRVEDTLEAEAAKLLRSNLNSAGRCNMDDMVEDLG